MLARVGLVVGVVVAEGMHCRLAALGEVVAFALEDRIVCYRWEIRNHSLQALEGCHCSKCGYYWV